MGKNEKKSKILFCEKCGDVHDGSYGSGRFCCKKCARSFSSSCVSKEGRKRQKEALNDPINREKCKKNRKTVDKKKKEHKKKTDMEIQLKEKKMKNRTDSIFKNRKMCLGKYGENVIINKCIENNIDVYIPVIDNGVDLIMDINGDLKKVQVKSSTQQTGINCDKTCFNLIASKRIGISDGKNKYYKKNYKDFVDMFALYDAIHDRSYLVENNDSIGKTSIIISQSKISKNNQSSSINFADDYDFDYVIENLKAGISQDDIIDVKYVDKNIKEDDD